MNILKRYFLKLLLISISMVFIAAPFVWVQIYYPHQAHSMSKFVSENFWQLTIFRLVLIGMFFILWPKLVQTLAKKNGWSNSKTQFWLNQKFRITCWLVVFELLVCENLLFHLFG